MKSTFCILVFSFLLTSCATIVNRPYKNISIYTTEPSEIIFNKDTVKTINNKINLRVVRKRGVLKFVASTDTLKKSFEVESQNSPMYWSNIFWNYGIGMLIDRENPKRFSYPRRIFINSRDTTSSYSKYGKANYKGELYLHFSFPHINSFRLSPENETTKINTGFWGLTAGLDFYHSKNQFINLSISGVQDFFVPIPAAVDIIEKNELMSSSFISLSNNYKINRFNAGYGLSYARNTWDFRDNKIANSSPQTREPIKRSHITLGFVFPTYYQLFENFHLGVIYRPTFYRPNLTNNLKYEHVISIDFAWKIRLIK